MAFPEFGKWCNCTGYLAKDKNEVCILASPPITVGQNHHEYEEVFAHIPNPSGEGYIDTPIDSGELVYKPLRKVVQKSFSGIVVGRSVVPVEEALYCEHNDDPYQEYDYIDKVHTEFAECFTVFFGNNRKRFVPVEMAEIITKE